MPQRRILFPSASLAFLMFVSIAVPALADERPRPLPAPLLDEPHAPHGGFETAVLSGGCFWGMQGLFEHVRGVRQVEAGYAGGSAATARYELVGTGTTGHAESVRIRYDPAAITYGEILRIFFSVAHDPTEQGRQGPDEGPQYRSEIHFANAMQARIARAYISQLSRARTFDQPIVTTVAPLTAFYPAEGYHQDYLIRHPESPYIVAFDLPKIAHLKIFYPHFYRADAVALSADVHSAS